MKSETAAIPLEKLLSELPELYNLADRDLIKRAYWVAEEVAPQTRTRLRGTLYQPLSGGRQHPGRIARADRGHRRRPAPR